MQIKRGGRGNEVVDVQKRLLSLGYDLGPTTVDGAFEQKTEAAVKAFQKQRRLPTTGIVDEATWRALVDATYRLGDRALYLRAPFFHGDDVKQLQTWLNTLGFRTEPMDGIFGPSTELAVREFQENVGLPGDGIVGASTLQALTSLTHVLDKEARVFAPAADPTSFVSIIQDRRISIGFPAPRKRAWLAGAGNHQMLCADLAHRLSNLVELLGGQIQPFRLGLGRTLEGQLVVAFDSRPAGGPPNSIAIRYARDSEDSRNLAAYVAEELLGSLQEDVGHVMVSDCPPFAGERPQVIVQPLQLANLEQGDSLQRDAFRQRIAGAVFDGLKKYLELTVVP